MADGIEITRVFDAPRERVWREWTEPERFADWFGGAEADVPVATVSMDVREGGAWRATMFFGPDRREIQLARRVPRGDRARAAGAHGLRPARRPIATQLVTVVLTDLGDGRTEMHFQQRGRQAPRAVRGHHEGWGKFFDRMAERMASG